MKPTKRLSLKFLFIGSLILSFGLLLNNYEIVSTGFGSNVPTNISLLNETNQTSKINQSLSNFINQDLPANDQIKSNGSSSSKNEIGFVMNINKSMPLSGAFSSSSSAYSVSNKTNSNFIDDDFHLANQSVDFNNETFKPAKSSVLEVPNKIAPTPITPSPSSSDLPSNQSSSSQPTSDQNQNNESKNNEKNNTYQRGEYLVDNNGIHYYNINNCSEEKGSSGIGNLSECEDAERELREES